MAQALPQVTIQLEPVADCADAAALSQRIETALRTAFKLRVPVALVPSGTLPRFELKAKRWVRQES